MCDCGGVRAELEVGIEGDTEVLVGRYGRNGNPIKKIRDRRAVGLECGAFVPSESHAVTKCPSLDGIDGGLYGFDVSV